MARKKIASIGVKLEPHIKEAADKAAADEHRSTASLVEMLLVGYLKSKGYLNTEGASKDG